MAYTAGESASHVLVVAEPETTVATAARLMRDNHVGALVVIETESPRERAVGMITDRDLVVEVMAMGLDPGTITVGDIMATDLATVGADDSVLTAVERMRERGVRRLPVLDAQGRVTGIVAMDDLVHLLAGGLGAMAAAVGAERDRERAERPAARARQS